MKRRIAILGSTGSIGVQALEVIEHLPDLFEVEVLTSFNNAELLIKQAKKFNPNAVVIVNNEAYLYVKEALRNDDIKVYAGEKALCEVLEMSTIDMVLSAIVGIAGLRPVYHAIKHGKTIALANKETLVVAGELITKTAREEGVNILPIDSEHSAIFQSLAGEFHNPIEKLIITASGGPFRGKKRDFLRNVTKNDALNHPVWSMGNKITIDSATLMNKGLEMIEAKWLFAIPEEKIEIVIHPQSIIHSLVQFEDGSLKAQLGLPDMKLPIQYALTYPHRASNTFPRFSFNDYATLTFETPDYDTFPCLNLAFNASKTGGNAPCILNAANEMAVQNFLNDKISFLEIEKNIEKALEEIPFTTPQTIDEYYESDHETRLFLKKKMNLE
ncbi:MAG TPA: 1-deoxy-D-xylulose-5-phosphate reductoisomerase [Bacteroidales bacterium]|nr:1-deoxy-D-xylulose-5-phosphate reductoisomerase [Bacteroidales bacterium]HQA86236.1 1-deoxy-D-xylulose-5-phosphate reductoisomerase [Bacteroidales bacterium]